MTTRKVKVGDTQIGLLEGLLAEPVEAMVVIDDRGAIITVPQSKSFFDLVREGEVVHGVELATHSSPVPESLTFRGTDQCFILQGCRQQGSSVVFGGNRLSQTRIRADRIIVDADTDVDYSSVHGLESRVEGLAAWSGMGAVSTTFENPEGPYPAVVLKGQNQPSHELGGPFNALLTTSFTHKPELWGEVHQIRETLLVKTRTEELRSLADHRRVHIMLQDLMCLVYGKAVAADATAVMHEDDQPYKDLSDKRLWRELYEPHFGRHVDGLPVLDTSRDEPLFHLSDTNESCVRTWMDQWNNWSRPTSIAVTTLFQQGTTIEARLLQIAVALEALGYSILIDEGKRPTRLANVEQALKAIFKRIPWEWGTILDGEKSTKWAQRFRTSYNGVKHADNPLPDPLTALKLARQGLTVMRAWQAHQLGVPEDVVQQALQRDSR